jgi:hypothetical protein
MLFAVFAHTHTLVHKKQPSACAYHLFLQYLLVRKIIFLCCLLVCSYSYVHHSSAVALANNICVYNICSYDKQCSLHSLRLFLCKLVHHMRITLVLTAKSM